MTKLARLETVHEAVACLRRLTEIFAQRRRELALAAGLTEQQWSVLDEIDSEAFMPSMFARQRESSAAAVSKILRQLQDKGLVVASLSQSDARQRNYCLTRQGRQALDRLRAERERAIEAVWRRLDESRVAAFASFGNELIERLERHSRETGAQHHAGEPARRGTNDGKDPVRQGV